MRSTPAPEMPARTVSEPSPADAAAASRAALAESRRLVLAGKAAEAERTLNDALRADPGNRDLRLALLEAACLNRSYKAAVAQLSLVEPLGDNEGPSLFYAAVALYETGHSKEARSYLGRAMPNVSGLLVDEYSTKILGQK
jgi:protein involved in temperature-dependent protein secretion